MKSHDQKTTFEKLCSVIITREYVVKNVRQIQIEQFSYRWEWMNDAANNSMFWVLDSVIRKIEGRP